MRSLPLATVTLLAPLLILVPAAPADAAVLCQGEEATIVGVGTETVVGTEGDDVIVAAGVISAGAGDDTICTSGSHVYAGDGDDSVTTYGGPVVERFVELGDGADRYVGSAGRDVVGYYFAFPFQEGFVDLGDDVVSTGAGDDEVAVGSLGSAPQADRLDLGPGDDQVNVFGSGLTAEAVVDGGPGRDALEVVTREVGNAVLDLPRRSLLLGDRAFVSQWTSLETHHLRLDGSRRTRVTGTPGRDVVSLAETTNLDVALGAGDDVLRIAKNHGGFSGRSTGGRGRDRIEVGVKNPRVDLRRGFVQEASRPRLRLSVSSFADVAAGPRSLVIGDAGPNRIDTGCGRVYSGGGADVVRQTRNFFDTPVGAPRDEPSRCPRFVVRGGPGNDRIRGSLSRDDLDGGPGRDRIDGLAGRDRCVAERRVRCER